MSDAPVVSVENGRGVYRASAVGICDRALIAARMGMTPADAPGWMLKRYEEGKAAENEILSKAVEIKGGAIHSQQEEVEIQVGGFAVIRGHIDGKHIRLSSHGDSLVEAKRFGPDFLKRWEQGPLTFFEQHHYYRDQLTIYMEGTGLPALYVVMDRETGKVSVTEIPEPPGDINEIIARILRIELAGRKGALPRECVNPSWPCPFFYLPGHNSKEAQPDNSNEFEIIAQECVEAREDKKRGEERAKIANKKLLEYMLEKDEKKLQGVGYVANRIASKNTSPDREAMKADGVWEKYSKVTEYEYAVAKRIEG